MNDFWSREVFTIAQQCDALFATPTVVKCAEEQPTIRKPQNNAL